MTEFYDYRWSSRDSVRNQQHFISSSSSQRKETLSSETPIPPLSFSIKHTHIRIPYISLFPVCLQTQAIVGCPIWMLGTALGSSTRAVCALSCWSIPPGPTLNVWPSCLSLPCAGIRVMCQLGSFWELNPRLHACWVNILITELHLSRKTLNLSF